MRGRNGLLSLLDMADFTGRIVTPFLMATKTLTVVGTFQAWLLEVFISRIGRVTVLARGDAADFLEVVAILTAAIHGGHFGVQTM